MLTSVSKNVASAVLGAVAAAILVAVPGETLAADDEPGRYTMTPIDGGVARLDRETGAVSICSGKEGNWACSPVAERQQEMERRIKELESENRQLKTERATPVTPSQPGVEGAPPDIQQHGDATPPAPPGDLPVPTEKDVDKLFDYVEGMVKKFKERIERLEREAQKDETPL